MANGRPFAVFDIDGTLIRWQLYHSIADTLAKRGFIDTESYQNMKNARMVWKRRFKDKSFTSYEKQVIRIFDGAVKKLSVAEFNSAVNEVFEEYKDQAYTYGRNLVKELKRKNFFLLAISGSPEPIVAKIASHYGFNDYRGAFYYVKNERFTGAKRVSAYYKGKLLKELVQKNGLVLKDSLGIGDTKSDIAMLELVENPIAFNPEQALFAYAQQKGWKIVVERKNVIYKLEKHNGRYELVETNG